MIYRGDAGRALPKVPLTSLTVQYRAVPMLLRRTQRDTGVLRNSMGMQEFGHHTQPTGGRLTSPGMMGDDGG